MGKKQAIKQAHKINKEEIKSKGLELYNAKSELKANKATIKAKITSEVSKQFQAKRVDLMTKKVMSRLSISEKKSISNFNERKAIKKAFNSH